jgi:hypothetical protein
MRLTRIIRRLPGACTTVALLAVVIACGATTCLQDASASSHVGLGSRALAKQIHATGIGSAHPRKFDVGQFPIFDRIHWKHWGAATATGLGVNLPDGAPGLPRAQILADARGRCDGQTVYRRIKARVREGDHWGRWLTLSPVGATTAHRGLFCLDAVGGG